MVDITAQNVATTLISGWISSYGIPLYITTDLGKQFESAVFKKLMEFLEVKHLRTTPYHPQSNGIIERWHRSLKSAIKCSETNSWSAALSLILLGMRTAVKSNIGLSPAEMAFGAPLRIPGEFLVPRNNTASETEFTQALHKAILSLPSTNPQRHGNYQQFIPPLLGKCKFVFVRIDRVRTPLPIYEGSFEVINKYEKCFILKIHQREVKISIDRLKAAYLFNDTANAIPINPFFSHSSSKIPSAKVERKTSNALWL
ncbi:uncharacterized protein LOC119666001 [Teleopsis dalmanni]|uniref:uncharacterized protein LOC119666001 n=1 Tax=Teleopsis dalmanni TaxID=139649 RepID=UPI0018CD3D90|nr:uncharacterized protein LOC119666001 [Teleopsis dalmanni]